MMNSKLFQLLVFFWFLFYLTSSWAPPKPHINPTNQLIHMFRLNPCYWKVVALSLICSYYYRRWRLQRNWKHTVLYDQHFTSVQIGYSLQPCKNPFVKCCLTLLVAAAFSYNINQSNQWKIASYKNNQRFIIYV